MEGGGKRVTGCGVWTAQIAFASERNRVHLDTGKIRLFEAPRERALDISCVDLVFSIYAIGWTVDSSATFRNMATYLRPGSRLIWSWGHPLFPELWCIEGRFVLPIPTLTSMSIGNMRRAWCGTEGAVIQNGMLSSWICDLTDAGFVIKQLLEPEAESCPGWVFNNNRSIPMVRPRVLPATLIFVCNKV